MINNTVTTPKTKGLVTPQSPQMPVATGMAQPTIPSVSTAPIGSLGGAVKSHTITISPDGTQKHTVSHDTGEKQSVTGLVSPQISTKQPEQPQMPPIHVLNGMHHVPFRKPDGSWGHINAKGEII